MFARNFLRFVSRECWARVEGGGGGVKMIFRQIIHKFFFPPRMQILHMHIASVEKLPLSTTGSPLLIRCKSFLSVTFVISRERDSHDVYSTLIKLCQPGELINVL